MKKVEEFIEFLIWFKKQDQIIKNALDPSNTVKLYLNSINSASVESRNVMSNEDVKKLLKNNCAEVREVMTGICTGYVGYTQSNRNEIKIEVGGRENWISNHVKLKDEVIIIFK